MKTSTLQLKTLGDHRACSLAEELEREPDGVPHAVVGLTAFLSVMLALLVGVVLLASRGAAVVVVLVAIPLLVRSLAGKAQRERDQLHP